MGIDNNTHSDVLVIGGAGFIGQYLLNALVSEGFRVISVDVGKPSMTNPAVEYHEGDFTTRSVIEPLIQRCDAIYHLASTTLPRTSNDDPGFDIQTNLIGTISLLEMATHYKVSKFIYISSGGTVYGVPTTLPVAESHSTEPLCSYGIVKLAAEKYLGFFSSQYGLNTVSLRLSNPYGEYQRADRAQGAVSVFCDRAIRGEPIQVWGDGSVVRDFIYISDAVSALIKCLELPKGNHVLNIGYGKGTSLNQLLARIESALGKSINISYLPSRSFDVPEIYLDITKATNILSWSPKVSLDEGVCKVVRWMKSKM